MSQKIKDFEDFFKSLPDGEKEIFIDNYSGYETNTKFQRFKLTEELRKVKEKVNIPGLSEPDRYNIEKGDYVLILGKVTDITDFNENYKYEDNYFFIEVTIPTYHGNTTAFVDPTTINKIYESQD